MKALNEKKKHKQLFKPYELSISYNSNENSRRVPRFPNVPNWVLFLHFNSFNVVMYRLIFDSLVPAGRVRHQRYKFSLVGYSGRANCDFM